jgi:natural product precursor
MKKLQKLRLNALKEQYLAEKQMKVLSGGECVTCQCSCYWAGNGGSSIASNKTANAQHGYSSVDGYNRYTVINCS